MADLGQNLKTLVLRGMEAIGSTASSIANSTKQKVDVYNLQSEMKDLLQGLGTKVIDLWKQGEKLPEELTADIEKIILVDEQLKAIQRDPADEAPADTPDTDSAEQQADSVPDEKEAAFAESEKEEAPQAAVYTAGNDHDVPVIEVAEKPEEKEQPEPFNPLSSAINDLFEQAPSVDKMAEKVNSSLDELGENLKKFSDKLGKGIEELAQNMMNDDQTEDKDK